MQLRPHQITACDAIWKALQSEHSVLLEAACSAGKTLIFSKITQKLLSENPSFRVLILMDREILVKQTYDKIIFAAPELSMHVGIACASVSSTKQIGSKVTIASRQTLINMLNSFESVQLIIVDECHLMAIPKEGQESDQYGQIIETLRRYNPNTRLLGVTASPYRLVDGHIYGDKNSPGCMPYFPHLTHRITVEELQQTGYLAPLIGKTVAPESMGESLSNVGLIGGEYNLGRLNDLMSQSVHIESAVKVWQEHASDRKKTLAFCVSIKHSELMAEAFNQAGISAHAIHSELDDMTNYVRMQSLEKGHAKVFTSVAKLTTGMDIPDIDCILLTRPTKSTALYKQMLGRGQRIAKDKIDCLVLDMVKANDEHGTNLDKLKVRWNRGGKKDGKATSKECPECAADLHPACRVCPECNYEYPAKDFSDTDAPDMVDAEYGAKPPVEMIVTDMFVDSHLSKKGDTEKALLRIRLELESGQTWKPFISASMWMCFPDYYSGFAVNKGKALWQEMATTEPPKSLREALDRKSEIIMPDIAIVDISGRWPEIKGIRYETYTPQVIVEDDLDIPF